MTQVSIEGLTKVFGKLPAVDGISMRIEDGEFISLLGPSGCGKTTTLKMIAGFVDATGGAIRFDGADVVDTPAEKRDIGMVFQNYALFPHMSVSQNLAFGLEMRKVPKARMKERIAAVLEMVQLAHLADRYPSQLSGGQQQRVALARALVIEPRILLLDEPLANLDAKLREEMRVFIRELQRRVGITTVYVTHDQAEAMTMSDRVVVMFGGRIAQMGAPADIYQRPENIEVAQFVGQVNLIDGQVARLEGDKAHVACVFGEVEAPHRDMAGPGTAVTLGLRPEALSLGPAGAAGAAGAVTARYYSGSLIDYRVALATGETMHVQTFPDVRFEEGDAVTVHAPADAFWLIGAAR
ncbi:ABC transporter ATP-binding protein [Aureimonas populi]|uniref:ABC transporter ATP-binding protein n=1 Tax=Aureimonas populi TaxID=1701758 RepID=A0ABW5CJS6_9HYPH|nr:ABC transporter ATP-binding protein [Aureimonas populi]